MASIIKMDIIRMFKQKSFYILHIIAILIMLINILFMVAIKPEHKDIRSENNLEISKEVEDDIKVQKISKDVVINDILFPYNVNNINLVDIAKKEICGSSNFILIGSIFMVLFISGELSSGYIKNLLSDNRNRYRLILSKIVSICILGVIFLILNIIMICLENMLLSKGSIEIGDLNVLIMILIKSVLIYITVGIIINMIVYFTRSKVISMVLSICISINIFIIIFLIFDDYFKTHTYDYWIMNMYSSPCLTLKDLLFTVFVCVISAILATGIAIIRFKRVDIK